MKIQCVSPNIHYSKHQRNIFKLQSTVKAIARGYKLATSKFKLEFKTRSLNNTFFNV